MIGAERVAAPQLPDDEAGAPHLRRGMAQREGQAAIAERLGSAAAMARASSMLVSSSARTRGVRGPNQLVVQQVYCQPSQTANHSATVCAKPNGIRCSSRPWLICVAAKGGACAMFRPRGHGALNFWRASPIFVSYDSALHARFVPFEKLRKEARFE